MKKSNIVHFCCREMILTSKYQAMYNIDRYYTRRSAHRLPWDCKAIHGRISTDIIRAAVRIWMVTARMENENEENSEKKQKGQRYSTARFYYYSFWYVMHHCLFCGRKNICGDVGFSYSKP